MDYARSGTTATTPRPAPPTRRFRPGWLPTLAAALLVPLFIAAGQWQWNKAAIKADLQRQLDVRSAEPAVQAPTSVGDAQTLNYRMIIARGRYEPQYQILIDNRTYLQQAGFHVITPFRLEGSEVRLLINRGWIPALAEHRHEPAIDTPSGIVTLSGMAVVPGTRFFTLAAEAGSDSGHWQRVWQNLDLDRYSQAVPFPIQPVVIQLDPESVAGGFTREWIRPDNRRQTNLNYAMQWWGFAATTLGLWVVLGLRRKTECARNQPC